MRVCLCVLSPLKISAVTATLPARCQALIAPLSCVCVSVRLRAFKCLRLRCFFVSLNKGKDLECGVGTVPLLDYPRGGHYFCQLSPHGKNARHRERPVRVPLGLQCERRRRWAPINNVIVGWRYRMGQ